MTTEEIETIIKTVREAFSKFLEKHREVEAILLYGSHARKEATPRSDIDICLVVPEARKNPDKGIHLIQEAWREVPLDFSKYDLRVFELLPLYIQMSIIKNHVVIWTRNELNLYEYLYFNYLKPWKDQEKRYQIHTYV